MSAGPIDAVDAIGGAADLARAFDRTFAEPARSRADDVEKLLGLSAGGHAYAVRFGEIRSLLPEQKIVPVPGPVSELLGVAGLRGNIVPIYDLGALLGHRATSEHLPWILLVGVDLLVGLAFERFDGYLRVARAEISAMQDQAPRTSVKESALVAGAGRGIICVPAVIETVRERVRNAGQNKET